MKNQKLKKLLDQRMSDFDMSRKFCKPWKTKPWRLGFKIKWCGFDSKEHARFDFIHLYRERAYFTAKDIEDLGSGSLWERKIKKLCPLQFFLRDTLPFEIRMIKTRVWHRWYEFKCWLRPYNVLKINSLQKTWIDEDRLLVHAMFAVLERYFSEKPDEIVCFDDEPHKTFWKEINEVWTWWHERHIRDENIENTHTIAYARRKIKDMPFVDKYKELIELEAQYEKEEQWALETIIKYRHHLWV